MLVARNLVKNYGEKEALRGVSFTIKPGEITGYLGPNGAGKSTTIRIIVGTLAPTTGEVEVCGWNATTHPLEAKRRIGYVPESGALYETLSPNEYLSLIAELHELDPGEARDRIARLIDAFELTNAANLQMTGFSKGMRQKVLLIGALLHDPEVLLLDEPLNGLDAHAGSTLRRLVEGLAERGKTILYCSHVLDVMERVCARVLILNQGQLVADDSPSNLMRERKQGTLEAVFRELTQSGGDSGRVDQFLNGVRTGSPRAHGGDG